MNTCCGVTSTRGCHQLCPPEENMEALKRQGSFWVRQLVDVHAGGLNSSAGPFSLPHLSLSATHILRSILGVVPSLKTELPNHRSRYHAVHLSDSLVLHRPFGLARVPQQTLPSSTFDLPLPAHSSPNPGLGPQHRADRYSRG